MRRSFLLCWCAAPLLASCVFLLDYDDLQSGPGNVAAGGRSAEAGAGPTTAGQAGADNATCGDCNDGNPCTIDTCDATGDTPACQHEATEGLKLDGFEVTLEAPQHVRVSLVGSGQRFYLAALAVADAGPRLSLYGLASDDTELQPIGMNLQLEGDAVSNAGLAVEELALGEIALHGFVATRLRPGDAARVFHLVLRGDEVTRNLVGASYRADIETVFPQALAMGGTVVGAWIQTDGTIAVHDVGSAKTDTFGEPALPATTLSLLSTKDSLPAVMYTAQARAEQALGTYVETSGKNRAKVVECETRPGDYLSASVISTQVPGVWLGNVTRAGADYLTTGSTTLVCSGNACAAVAEDCEQHPSPNSLRNVAGATVHFDTDAAGVIYSVVAVPQIAVNPDDTTQAEGKLSLLLGRTNFSAQPPESTSIGGDPATGLMDVAQVKTSLDAAFAGPDWPAVAILPSRRVAVAWLQPSASGNASELHVQRYQMCLPDP